MRKLFLCLLFLSCRPTLPSNSQPVKPLVSRVVTLDSGTVAIRAYTCMDSVTYRLTRQAVAQVLPLQQKVQLLEYDRALLQKSLDQQHGAGTKAGQDFNALATETRKLEQVQPMPPLLLSPQFYKGTAFGAAALLALKLFFHL